MKKTTNPYSSRAWSALSENSSTLRWTLFAKTEVNSLYPMHMKRQVPRTVICSRPKPGILRQGQCGMAMWATNKEGFLVGCLGYVGDDKLPKYIPGTPNNQVFYGCFNWMIPNLYIKNGCSTKHPLKNGCLVYQVGIIMINHNVK